MPRPRLVPTALAFAALMLGVAGPAWPAPMPVVDLAQVQEIATKEGLAVKTVRQAGPTRLYVASEGPLTRQAFIRRASLLAYFVFERLKTPVAEIEFHNQAAGAEQLCYIRQADYMLYLQDRITRDEYERRLGYEGSEAGIGPLKPAAPKPAAPVSPPVPEALAARPLTPPAVPALPAAPATPAPRPIAPATLPVVAPVEAPVAPRAPRVEPAASPLAPRWTPLVGFAWGLGLGGGSYDAYQLEYGHPLLRTVDVRPSLQILSPFSPINFMAGNTRPMQGLSLATDLLGTSRQDVTALGLSFDGGLGARLAMLQGNGAQDFWPALHLRLGLRWQLLAVGMRYPLFSRANDPLGGWEASVGLSMPLDRL